MRLRTLSTLRISEVLAMSNDLPIYGWTRQLTAISFLRKSARATMAESRYPQLLRDRVCG
jgi:hypothetical protein